VKIDVKGQGATGTLGQTTGQGAVLPIQITSQGAALPGQITGQGASVHGGVIGQGAGVPDAKVPVDRKIFLDKSLVGMKMDEQVEHGGGDEVDMARTSLRWTRRKSRRVMTTTGVGSRSRRERLHWGAREDRIWQQDLVRG
jgi:hypothetical protein